MTVLRRTLHLAAVGLLAVLTAAHIIAPARADWIGNTEHGAGSPVTWWRSARIIIRERWRD